MLTADLHWAADVNSAGFVAGWLQSANVCGRAVASSLWGLVAHRYGPRPVLRITLAALFVGGVLFGLCRSLAAAMAIRFLCFGLLNGWSALLAVCAAQVAGEARQAEVLGLIIASGSGTQLVGPAVGGWTYGAVRSFPALVPSAIGCGLVLVAALLWVDVADREEVKDHGSGEGLRAALCRWPMPLLRLAVAGRFRIDVLDNETWPNCMCGAPKCSVFIILSHDRRGFRGSSCAASRALPPTASMRPCRCGSSARPSWAAWA